MKFPPPSVPTSASRIPAPPMLSGEQPFYEAGLKSARSKESLKVKMDEQGTVIAEYGKH